MTITIDSPREPWRHTSCGAYVCGAGRAEWVATLCLLALAGCSKEPFSYAKVHGKVTYEDGSVIPVDPLMLRFYPLDIAQKGKQCPRPGSAMADKLSGKFDSVSSHGVGDGLAVGKYKVTLGTIGPTAMPPTVLPPEYTDTSQTPLVVDTADSPFELKVRKPR